MVKLEFNTVQEGIRKVPRLPATVEVTSGTRTITGFCRGDDDYGFLVERAVEFGHRVDLKRLINV